MDGWKAGTRLRLSSLARAVLPAHRRWSRLLSSLTLDPAMLPDRLDEPGPRDYFICGAPRTGTSLLAAMLFQPPKSIVVMEPWDTFRLPPSPLFKSLRDELQSGQLGRGRLDVDALRSEGAVEWIADGAKRFAVDSEADFALGVKFPAVWQYLGRLRQTRFLVCVRDPVETITSFANTGGRLAMGFEYDIPFNRSLNRALADATDDPTVRRALLYERINRGILPHLGASNVLTVRYERWHAEPTQLLEEIARFLDADLSMPLASIKAPRPSHADRQTADLVARHCPVAGELGYLT